MATATCAVVIIPRWGATTLHSRGNRDLRAPLPYCECDRATRKSCDHVCIRRKPAVSAEPCGSLRVTPAVTRLRRQRIVRCALQLALGERRQGSAAVDASTAAQGVFVDWLAEALATRPRAGPVRATGGPAGTDPSGCTPARGSALRKCARTRTAIDGRCSRTTR